MPAVVVITCGKSNVVQAEPVTTGVVPVMEIITELGLGDDSMFLVVSSGM